MRRFQVLILTAALATAPTVGAAQLHVDASGGDDGNDGLSWLAAKATIQAAVDAAALTPEPDTIAVASATYAESIRPGSDLTLAGGYPPGGGLRDLGAYPTTVGGLASGPVFRLQGVARVVIDGFVVYRGRGDGGGLRVDDSDEIVLRDLVVHGNFGQEHCEARWGGMGCTLQYPEPNPVGVGLLARASDVDVFNCLFHSNSVSHTAYEDVECLGGCTAAGIAPVYASTLLLADCTGTLTNVTVTGNDCYTDISQCESAVGVIGGQVDVVDSVFQDLLWDAYRSGSPDASYSAIASGNTGGVGNTTDDPLFVAGPLGDHYLSQVGAGQGLDSPCLDTGSRSAVAAGLDAATTSSAEAPDSGIVDMGYHYPPSTAPAVDLLAAAGAGADLAAIYSGPCGIDRGRPEVRVAVSGDNVAPGVLFDSAEVEPGAVTFYQLECSGRTIRLSKDPAGTQLRLDL